MQPRYRGTIIHANRVKSFFFIMPDSNQSGFPFADVDFYSHITQVEHRENLKLGQRVSFALGTRGGRTIAIAVQKLNEPLVPAFEHTNETGLAGVAAKIVREHAEAADPTPRRSFPLDKDFISILNEPLAGLTSKNGSQS
jgi:cold shock CspA family protein